MNINMNSTSLLKEARAHLFIQEKLLEAQGQKTTNLNAAQIDALRTREETALLAIQDNPINPFSEDGAKLTDEQKGCLLRDFDAENSIGKVRNDVLEESGQTEKLQTLLNEIQQTDISPEEKVAKLDEIRQILSDVETEALRKCISDNKETTFNDVWNGDASVGGWLSDKFNFRYEKRKPEAAQPEIQQEEPVTEATTVNPHALPDAEDFSKQMEAFNQQMEALRQAEQIAAEQEAAKTAAEQAEVPDIPVQAEPTTEPETAEDKPFFSFNLGTTGDNDSIDRSELNRRIEEAQQQKLSAMQQAIADAEANGTVPDLSQDMLDVDIEAIKQQMLEEQAE